MRGTPSCMLGLALCFEDESLTKWSAAKAGHSHLLVQVWLAFMDNPLIVVVAHLPHRGRPFEDFQLACFLRCMSGWGVLKGHDHIDI